MRQTLTWRATLRQRSGENKEKTRRWTGKLRGLAAGSRAASFEPFLQPHLAPKYYLIPRVGIRVSAVLRRFRQSLNLQ